jgi:hypothetical protein
MFHTFCLLILLAPLPVNNPSATVSPFHQFSNAVTDILDAGIQLWDKIGAYQADSVVQKVASGAVNIQTYKTSVERDILSGQIQNYDQGLSDTVKDALALKR